MQIKHVFLALTCVFLWGTSFLVIKLGLIDLPPLLFASLRFGLVATLALALPKPNISWTIFSCFGLGWGVIQFGCLFVSIHLGMPSGIGSVIAQSQVFFTIIFASIICSEKLEFHKALALIITTFGLLIFLKDGSDTIPTSAFFISLLGAAGWASGNIIIQKLSKSEVRADTLAFIAWTSIIPAITLAALSYIFESDNMEVIYETKSVGKILIAIFYQAIAASIIGTMIWNHLLFKYSASEVAPFSLMVPVIGLFFGVAILGESLSKLQIYGCILLIIALAINLFWPRLRLYKY